MLAKDLGWFEQRRMSANPPFGFIHDYNLFNGQFLNLFITLSLTRRKPGNPDYGHCDLLLAVFQKASVG